MCAQQAISSTFSKSLGACVPRRQSLIDEIETCIAPASSRILAAPLAPCPSNESNTAGENANVPPSPTLDTALRSQRGGHPGRYRPRCGLTAQQAAYGHAYSADPMRLPFV